jgi:hypothetical protein
VRDWEKTFSQWAKPPGMTEEARCENAIKAIRNAISNSGELQNRNIKVFVQGSFRNNVNVRKDSDVDVGVVCFDSFYPVYPEGQLAKSYGHSDATYRYVTFKAELVEALRCHFGSGAVESGNKAIDVKENSYHVEADVVPFFEHRRYARASPYLSGVALFPDEGGVIINWPEQHNDNGVRKNKDTSRRYKSVVRILKSLRIEMQVAGLTAADPIVGFLIECMIFNSPNTCFIYETWDQRLQACLHHLSYNTAEAMRCAEWGEVSELTYLFKHDASKREKARAFVDAARNYVGVRRYS